MEQISKHKTPVVSDSKGLLAFCQTPRTRAEIMDIASGQYALRRYLDPLIESGAISLTLKDKPRSPKQQRVATGNFDM